MTDPAAADARIFRSTSGALFAAMGLLVLAHAAYTFPHLPGKVASHFDGAGRPDGWMERGAFVTFEILLVAVLGLSTGGIAAWLPHIPDSLINLPHKDHWLTPERRSESLAWVGRALLLMGAASFVLILLLMDETVRVAMGEQEGLEWFGWTMAGYLVFTVVWTVWLILHFRKPR